MRKVVLYGGILLALMALSPAPWAWTAESGETEKEAASVDGTLEFGIRPRAPSAEPAAAPDSPVRIESASPTGEASEKKGAVDEPSSGQASVDTAGKGEGKASNGIADDYKEDYQEEKDEYAGQPQETPDPFEKFNRTMYGFNDFLYENVMNPVATVYSEMTDDDFRGIVKSFFYNAKMPVRLVSSVIQGDSHKAGRVLSRFLINTIMTAGLVDVAKTEFGLPPVEEDFDQALGSMGIKTGPYFVWPLIGPSTARSTVGGFVDGLLDPSWLMAPGFGAGFGMSSGKKINQTAINLGVKEDIDDMSVDPYLGVRDLYLQYRKGQLEE